MKIIRTLTCEEASERAEKGDTVYVILLSGWNYFEYMELDSEQTEQIMDLLKYYENDPGVFIASSFFDISIGNRMDVHAGNVIFTHREAKKMDDFWKLVGMFGDGIRK